jgi:PAS domain S-box-containing protein
MENQMNNYTVLYAEDEPEIQNIVLKILKNYFGNILLATDGEEALEIFNTHKVDLLITDICMPKLNGIELITKIREHLESIPILVMSANNDKEYFLQCIKLKVSGFVTKPLDIEDFKSEILERLREIDFKNSLERNEKLFQDYKDALDRSALVSKTDPNGFITYVNESFCKTSGYAKEELIGKNHNIIRHSDMPKSAFKNLWETIKRKEPWHGVVKNRKKDGGFYYVNSNISPIVNINGEVEEYISIREDITELELYKNDIEKQLELATKDIVDTQKEVILTMGAIGESRSKETGYHVIRVAEYSYILATLANLSKEDANLLKQASPMHDIGKVGIPDKILKKPGKLTSSEWEIMKSHSIMGYDMLGHSSRAIMKAAATIAYEHHEKWDGTGYPQGLKGEEIHIFGRITAIADVFDALGSDRYYKKAWSLDKILKLIEDDSGTAFDPKLAKLFLDNIEQFLDIRESLSDTKLQKEI